MHRREHLNEGQAMVEFALSLPILLFFILGIIDFGVALFSYSHASNALRSALRQAEIIGYTSEGEAPPYLDCAELKSMAGSGWFSSNYSVDVTYIKAGDPDTTYTCDTVSADVLDNGDILRLHMTATVNLLFLPLGPLNLEFQGERSIVRSIRVQPLPESGGSGGPTVPVPPAPINFDANVDCATGIVTFGWNWGTTSPLPTRAEIRDVADDSVVIYYSGNMSYTTCDGTCHDTILVPGGSRNYYIVAYNGTGTSQKVSEHSNTDAVTCSASDPELPVPPAPTNLVASANCSTGIVTFSWLWGTISPMPTRAEIRDATTGVVRVNYTGIMDPPSCTGTCFDAMPVPGSRSYNIVAVNGTEPNEKFSPPSLPATVQCTDPTTTSVVEVKLRQVKNAATCAWFNTYFGGRTVTLKNLDTLAEQSLPTDAFGTVTFSALPPGNYQVSVPASFTDAPKTYYLVSEMESGVCQGLSTTTFNFALSPSLFRTLTFGYQE